MVGVVWWNLSKINAHAIKFRLARLIAKENKEKNLEAASKTLTYFLQSNHSSDNATVIKMQKRGCQKKEV